MRVLGIDPGSHRTGWGVIEANGSRVEHIASGTIEARGETLGARLRAIADGLDDVMAHHRPMAVAVETIFHAKNSRSALQLGHARGVALLCAARFGASIHEYTAGQIKQATTGRGRADKEQVQKMVQLILGLRDELGLDTSDALAAAICHSEMGAHPMQARPS
ncbi:MAG: crossover junction endodeoxyribonuclease RuvC [Myxococcota bacterium]